MKVTDKYVFFWKEHPFCNFTKCVIKYEDETFTSSEQLFMWMKAKFFKDEKSADKILKAKTPEDARKLGRLVSNYNDSVWDENRVGAMFQAVWSKFLQNEDLRKKLCDEKYAGKKFVEAAYYDRIWGIGFDENDALNHPESEWGRNELGQILNKVRELLLLKSAEVYMRVDE